MLVALPVDEVYARTHVAEPKCGHSFDHTYKYCPECGQAVQLIQRETSRTPLAGFTGNLEYHSYTVHRLAKRYWITMFKVELPESKSQVTGMSNDELGGAVARIHVSTWDLDNFRSTLKYHSEADGHNWDISTVDIYYIAVNQSEFGY